MPGMVVAAIVASAEPRRRRPRRMRIETLADIRRRQLLGETDTSTSAVPRSRGASRWRAGQATVGGSRSQPRAAAAARKTAQVPAVIQPPGSPQVDDGAFEGADMLLPGVADALPGATPTRSVTPSSTPPRTPRRGHTITPVSFADAFATSLPSLFADEEDEPLPQLSSRAGTPVQDMRGLRSRDGMSRPTSRERPVLTGGLLAPEHLSEWRPGSSDGVMPRRTPSARRRQDRALVRSRSSASRAQSLSRDSRRSTRASRSGPNDADVRLELHGAVAYRHDFFELWKEKQRHCTEEGDDADRPDSARNVYLESAVPHGAVNRCSVYVRLKHYSGGGAGSLRGGRVLALLVDANATVLSVKAQIRDHVAIAIGRQVLFHDEMQLEDSSTIADLGLHRSVGPVTLQLVINPAMEAASENAAGGVQCHTDIAEAFGVVTKRSNPYLDLAANLHEHWESSESLLRAKEKRAKSTFQFSNPSTGREKFMHCSTLPLPLLVDTGTLARNLPVAAGRADDVELLVLNRNGQRMGNTMMVSYAEGLRRLVAQGVKVSEMHLANNWLSGDGAVGICRALAGFSFLKLLDLGGNRIGTSGATAVADLLDQQTELQTLSLAKCELGDRAAACIIQAMVKHRHLTRVDLSHNGIGSTVLHPVRGHSGAPQSVQALADLMRQNAYISDLNLAWNSLSGDHVMPVMDALDENTGLKKLDLKWNGLGNEGAVPLGMAVRLNQLLLVLDVSHNDIQEKGTLVLADAMKENVTLTHMCLDSNPIGPDGGRAVLRALCTIAERNQEGREISIQHCNLACEDGEDIFDPLEPGGHHVCNLADPYERVVANELVELAWKQDGENWENETLDGQPFSLPEPAPGEVWYRDEFALPENGVLELTFVPTKRVPRMESVVSARVLDRLEAMMNHPAVTDQGLGILRLACSELFFSCAHAARFLSRFTDSPTRVTAVALLQQRIVDYMNLTAVIYSLMTDGELSALEQKIGQLFYFTPSNPTGRYKLNLANPSERAIARRIIEISSEEKITRKATAGAINTSQNGDWDNWRNEILDGKPWDYNEQDPSTSKLPAIGILQFDYVSTNVYHRLLPTLPISDSDFLELLKDLQRAANLVVVKTTVPNENTVVEQRNSQPAAAEPSRRPWWIPSQNLLVSADSPWERDAMVRTRQLRMLRRSTLIFYYSAAQVDELLTTVLAPSTWLEACIILFSRIIDLENHRPQQYLSIDEYVGQDYGQMQEGHIGAENKHTDTSSYIARIGATNAFNPFWCDRNPMLSTDENVRRFAISTAGPAADKAISRSSSPRAAAVRPDGQLVWTGNPPRYDLRMGIFEERMVCKLLVALASENGDNWSEEYMSGMPFKLSPSWAEPEPKCGVPKQGTISLQLCTAPGTLDLSLRAGIAKRLLMPGPGRWRCVPTGLADQDPSTACINVCDEPLQKGGGEDEWDDRTDTSLLCLDADNCVKTVDEVFRDFDRDRSGQMDFDEYLAAMKRLRVDSTLARQLFEAADLPDGELDVEEFRCLWKKMRSAQFGARE